MNATHTSANHDPTITNLVQGIMQDAQRLCAQQIDLFKIEIRNELRSLLMGIAMIAVGAALALLGGLMLCFMATYLLAWAFQIEVWISFAIVGGVLFVTGAILAYLAAQKFASFSPLPEQSLSALKENFQWQTNRN